MTRTEARYIANKLLKAGYRHPTINENIETGEITVNAFNRCWLIRTIIDPTPFRARLNAEQIRDLVS